MSRSAISLLILIIIAIISIAAIIFILLTTESVSEVEPIAIPISIITTSIMPSNPTVCDFLTVQVEFTNSTSQVVDHVNYDILAVQNDVEVISDESAHRHPNKHPIHQSSVLLGVYPVDVTVTIQGIGHGDDIIPLIGNATSINFTPELLTNIDCEELHQTQDELPQ